MVFAETLRKGQTNQGNALLGDLGYSAAFFSEGEHPVGYQLHTGDRKGMDSFVVRIPEARQRGLFAPERMGRPCAERGDLPALLGLRGCGAPAGGWLPGRGRPSCPLLAELLAGADGPKGRETPHPSGLRRDGDAISGRGPDPALLPPTEKIQKKLARRLGLDPAGI